MEGTKLKNIVIIILILVNGFLLVLSGGRRLQNAQSHETARLSAIEVIRASGVSLDDAVVPHEITLRPVQVVRDLEAERQLAEKLLGGAVTAEVRGGDVYRYSNDAGFVQFHSTGEFSAEFAAGVFPAGQQELQMHARTVLELLDFKVHVQQYAVMGQTEQVICHQMAGQIPLLGCRATLNYVDGQLVSITDGYRLFGWPGQTTEESTVTVATALMRLYNGLKEMGDVYNCIEKIAPAYTVNINMAGSARLEPVWYVQTDTGNYQLDMITGELARAGGYGGTIKVTAQQEQLQAVDDAQM